MHLRLASGQASGKRQHKPIVVRKEIDRSSPLLFNALVTNETLKSVVITRTTSSGTYEVRLTNAQIVDITHSSRDSGGDAYEEISFTFQRIEMSFNGEKGKTTAADDWAAQR